MAALGTIIGCVGNALLQHGLRALAGAVPGGSVFYEVCAASAGEWKKSVDRAKERQVIEQMLAKSRDEIKAEVAQQVAELKKHATPEQAQQLADPKVAQGLELYLETIPDHMRASLRRPEDPSGNSVPANFSLREERGFAAILPNRTPRFRTGDKVGNYVLTEPLGLGGFGEVWKTRHVRLSSRVAAIKFCLDEASQRNLRHESSLIDRVQLLQRQPGIVELWDAFLDHNPPYLVYQFIEGGDLTGLMRNLKTLPAKERETRAVEVMIALASIVAPLHAMVPPIIHRDLKPANILISRNNGQDSFWVTDFGIGALAAESALDGHRQGMSRGDLMSQSLRGTHTPVYASPEQRKHAEPDPRDDVHALAVIGYQLLLGDPTEEPGADLEDTLKHVKINEALIQVIKDALRSRREQRMEHAGVLADRLRSLAVGAPVKQEIKQSPIKEPDPIVRAPAEPKQPVAAPKVELPKTRTFDLGNGVNLEMVLIHAGTFMMGSPESEAERSDNEIQHQVTISKP
ncbi:MAG: protein kinase [Planctomycetota bacterium]|nr:protein kinase [Planctomycetota bacterium]